MNAVGCTAHPRIWDSLLEWCHACSTRKSLSPSRLEDQTVIQEKFFGKQNEKSKPIQHECLETNLLYWWEKFAWTICISGASREWLPGKFPKHQNMGSWNMDVRQSQHLPNGVQMRKRTFYSNVEDCNVMGLEKKLENRWSQMNAQWKSSILTIPFQQRETLHWLWMGFEENADTPRQLHGSANVFLRSLNLVKRRQMPVQDDLASDQLFGETTEDVSFILEDWNLISPWHKNIIYNFH